MTKHRLYNDDIEVAGSFDIEIDYLRLQFPNKSKISKRFRKHVKDFLKKEELKIVSQQFSFKKHHNYKACVSRLKDFKIYYKYKNPMTHKIGIKEYRGGASEKNEI